MAFQINEQPSNNGNNPHNNDNVMPFGNNVNQSSNQRKTWQADAFVNIYLPTREGGRTKIGAINLKASKPLDKQLLDFLADGGDEALASLQSRLIMDFRRADGRNGVELDLG